MADYYAGIDIGSTMTKVAIMNETVVASVIGATGPEHRKLANRVMEEALSRMEAGEDPEQIEAEMGDLLEGEEPFSFKEKTHKLLKQRPPKVDEELYYL